MNKYLEEQKRELIFEKTELFKICHASNICSLQDGTLIAGWFGGEREGSDDIAIYASRYIENKWTEPVLMAHDIEEPHWNPVFYQSADGSVHLFYKVGRQIREWYTMHRAAEAPGDDFKLLGELVSGDRGGRGPVRCKVINLSDGSILAGASTEGDIWTAYADRSEDGGRSWKLSNPIRIGVEYHGERTTQNSDIQVSEQSFYGRGVIQPTLWESESGIVHMLLRSTEGVLYRSDSYDYGKSWCEAYPTELPNNNSGIDVARFDDGMLVLCMNPVGQNWGARTPIVLKVSTDNGKTWEDECVLEDIPGEYSYPSIIVDGDRLYVTYTYDRKSIAFWQFQRKGEQ